MKEVDDVINEVCTEPLVDLSTSEEEEEDEEEDVNAPKRQKTGNDSTYIRKKPKSAD